MVENGINASLLVVEMTVSDQPIDYTQPLVEEMILELSVLAFRDLVRQLCASHRTYHVGLSLSPGLYHTHNV